MIKALKDYPVTYWDLLLIFLFYMALQFIWILINENHEENEQNKTK